MAALTKIQLDHAKARITAAKTAFINCRMATLGVEPDTADYITEQKLAMIRSGQAKMKAKINLDDRYCNVTDFFDFPPSAAMAEAKAAAKKWSDEVTCIRAEADAKEDVLLDELIMAADGKAALEKIVAMFA
jgi:ATP:corrinoid adenosyltransferase